VLRGETSWRHVTIQSAYGRNTATCYATDLHQFQELRVGDAGEQVEISEISDNFDISTGEEGAKRTVCHQSQPRAHFAYYVSQIEHVAWRKSVHRPLGQMGSVAKCDSLTGPTLG
jgi:hypothetical protein